MTDTPESGRVTLPRGNWVTFRDPWEVTEKDLREFRLGMPKAKAATTNVDESDDPELTEQTVKRNHYTWSWFVTDWGGPELDGVPVGPDAFEAMAVPLKRAIDRAIGPVIRELNGFGD